MDADVVAGPSAPPFFLELEWEETGVGGDQSVRRPEWEGTGVGGDLSGRRLEWEETGVGGSGSRCSLAKGASHWSISARLVQAFRILALVIPRLYTRKGCVDACGMCLFHPGLPKPPDL